MNTRRFSPEIRQVILDALPKETSLFERTPDIKYTYFPTSHAKALHPDSMLVVGIRGAGKSYWWSALQKEDHRMLIETTLPQTKITRDSFISKGFGENPSPEDYPGKDVLVSLLSKFDARQIWRSIVLFHLLKQGEISNPLSKLSEWKDRVGWVHENPEKVERFAFNADVKLEKSERYHLILFDALDRTADNWPFMFKLVRGLFQVLLEFRSYKRIRPKAFVRPDHLEDPSVMDFPDASKVFTQNVELSWPRNELYGLLWQYLANEPNKGKLFRDGCRIKFDKRDNVWIIPEGLRNNEETQRKVFNKITGPWMGRDRRRGFPYTWLPNHLGDTRRQVSPRSFLAALRYAADDNPRPDYEYALHYESIKRGVQEASKIRVSEMKEDYPWVDSLMKPLSGLTVPCFFEDIAGKWQQEGTLKQLKSASVKLPPAHLEAGDFGIRKDLEALGLFERMSDDRVNLPDVYRVGYGIGRRGGVRAVARK